MTQPTPSPSARAASQKFSMAQAQDHMSVSGKGRPSEDPCRRRPAVAADDDPEWRFGDPVQLKVEHPPACILAEQACLALAFPFGDQGGALAGRRVGDKDEPPWLAVADRGRRVGGAK